MLTDETRSKGGKAAAKLDHPAYCECGAGPFKNRMSYLGHRGNHGLAESLTARTGSTWTVDDALRDGLAAMGAAACDPAPWNGAWQRGHELLQLFRR